MVIRDLEDNDYETLCSWWSVHNFVAPPKSILPGTGYICDEIAAGYLYLTNSSICWMEWVVCDPDSEKAKRSAAINGLIDHICKQARFVGGIIVYTSTNNFAFAHRIKKLGFRDAQDEKKTNNYMKVL